MTHEHLRKAFEAELSKHHIPYAGTWSTAHGCYGSIRLHSMWTAYLWGYEANKKVKEAA